MKSWKQVGVVVMVGVLVVGLPAHVWAQQSSSTNYQVNEAFFGTGGELDASSTNYRAKQSAGDTASGPTASTNFRTLTGSVTDAEPMLEFIVSGADNDHGVLNPSVTSTGTTDIWVRTYNSSGYIMQSTGSPPGQVVHTLPGLSSPSTSQTNVEQFGINLRANTTPNVGADPVQVPDSSFSYGMPTADYDTPNLFKYVPGEIIAQSVTATGETHYKLSYVMNVSNLTPAGRYVADISVVVSAKF
jgi:hypothetical protein